MKRAKVIAVAVVGVCLLAGIAYGVYAQTKVSNTVSWNMSVVQATPTPTPTPTPTMYGSASISGIGLPATLRIGDTYDFSVSVYDIVPPSGTGSWMTADLTIVLSLPSGKTAVLNQAEVKVGGVVVPGQVVSNQLHYRKTVSVWAGSNYIYLVEVKFTSYAPTGVWAGQVYLER